MKKSLTLREQVAAAREEVDNWPESIKKATEIKYIFSRPDDDEGLSLEGEKKECVQALNCI